MLYQKENPHGGACWGEGLLDFSANTNPLGTPPGVLAALAAALPQVHRYPDPYCQGLVQGIGAFEGVEEPWILCGGGAAELIYAYSRAVRASQAVELAPTFSEYGAAMEAAGCEMRRYYLREENGFLLDGEFLRFLEQERPEVVFLCNPNNPTGRTIPRPLMEEILKLCHGMGVRLFVDECFLDLSDRQESVKDWLGQTPELLILKAFTKSYGLAGVRLGYCLCSDEALLREMAGATPPWNVSSLAQAAGVAALGETAFLQKTRALISRERPRLQAGLEELGLWVCPGEANYLLFRGPEGLGAALRKRGVALRSCANYHGLGPGWYRTAVKKEDENTTLLRELEQVLKEGCI